MRIFVDETGAPGINGQDYFVLGAVIFSSSSDEQRCSQAIDALRQSLGKPPKFEFKYNKNPASIQRRFLETTLTADWRFAGFIHRKEEPKERVQDLSPSRLKEWSVYNLVWGIEDCTRYAEMILDEGMGTNELSRLRRRLRARYGRRIIDSVFTGVSGDNNLLQVADYVAGVIKKKFFDKRSRHYDLIADRKIRIPCWNLK